MLLGENDDEKENAANKSVSVIVKIVLLSG
jgi:hypothetical protein